MGGGGVRKRRGQKQEEVTGHGLVQNFSKCVPQTSCFSTTSKLAGNADSPRLRPSHLCLMALPGNAGTRAQVWEVCPRAAYADPTGLGTHAEDHHSSFWPRELVHQSFHTLFKETKKNKQKETTLSVLWTRKRIKTTGYEPVGCESTPQLYIQLL